MLKIAICDDEQYYIDKIRKIIIDILEQYNVGKYLIKTYLSGVELCADIKNISTYKIIFLDVNMKQLSGLDTAFKIRKMNNNACIAFITAYIDYAVQGYKVDAIRYILKDELDKSLTECMMAMLRKIINEENKISYNFIEGESELRINKICYIENRKHKQIFHLCDISKPQFSLYSKLDIIEKELAVYGFLRIHKSFLVNIMHIYDIINYEVRLQTGACLPVPKDKYRFVKERYYEMIGGI